MRIRRLNTVISKRIVDHYTKALTGKISMQSWMGEQTTLEPEILIEEISNNDYNVATVGGVKQTSGYTTQIKLVYSFKTRKQPLIKFSLEEMQGACGVASIYNWEFNSNARGTDISFYDTFMEFILTYLKWAKYGTVLITQRDSSKFTENFSKYEFEKLYSFKNPNTDNKCSILMLPVPKLKPKEEGLLLVFDNDRTTRSAWHQSLWTLRDFQNKRRQREDIDL